jgi:hypothetical protein
VHIVGDLHLLYRRSDGNAPHSSRSFKR